MRRHKRRHRELSPGNKALDQQLGAVAPLHHLLAPGIVVDPHDADADARSLIGRLDDKGGRHRVALDQHFAAGDHAFRASSPASRNTALAVGLCIAMAEARTPEWV